jgi:hypothetical protein
VSALKEKLATAEEKIAKLENMNQQLMDKIRTREKEVTLLFQFFLLFEE